MFTILASRAAPIFVKVLLFPFMLCWMDLPVDVENAMIDEGIPFEIVEVIPKEIGVSASSFAVYSPAHEKIYFKSADGTFNHDEFLRCAIHEMIHYYWDKAGKNANDNFVNEAVACYGATELDKTMGMKNLSMYQKDVDQWFLESQTFNGLQNPRLLSNEEKSKIEKDIDDLKNYIMEFRKAKKSHK